MGGASTAPTRPSEGTQHMGGASTAPTRPRESIRRRRGSLARVLVSRALVVLVLVAGWFVGLRPYLHGLVQNQIDGVLSNVVNQIDLTRISGIPSGPVSIPVTEMTINNLIVLYSAPSDPVQHMRMQITPGGVRVDFQVYGFACDITGVPMVSNGQLIVANITVEGIVSLVMSSDEMASVLNAHLRDARAKLRRNVVSVILKEHEMDLMLG